MSGNPMYLYGKNSIFERLRANPKTIKKIFLQENFDAPHIVNAIRDKGIPVKHLTERALGRIKRADRLQGIIAEVDRFLYTDFGELLHRQGNTLSFICLDSINDPHNLGCMIRIAACLGGFSIVIPKHRSCEVNDTVMHVASGGENFVPVSMVNNLSSSLIKAKKAGYWIAGAVVENGIDIDSAELPFPMCLVLGSEGKGIRHGIEKQLDLKITLPMRGASLSLNVAMACAIFCHEITKKRPQN